MQRYFGCKWIYLGNETCKQKCIHNPLFLKLFVFWASYELATLHLVEEGTKGDKEKGERKNSESFLLLSLSFFSATHFFHTENGELSWLLLEERCNSQM